MRKDEPNVSEKNKKIIETDTTFVDIYDINNSGTQVPLTAKEGNFED